MKTVKKGRPPRKENRHVVQFGLLLQLDCRILGQLQVKTLLLQSSSRVQMPLTQPCIHIVTRTRFHMQIIVCSICHVSVGAYGALYTAIIVVVFDDFSAFQFHCTVRNERKKALYPKTKSYSEFAYFYFK